MHQNPGVMVLEPTRRTSWVRHLESDSSAQGNRPRVTFSGTRYKPLSRHWRSLQGREVRWHDHGATRRSEDARPCTEGRRRSTRPRSHHAEVVKCDISATANTLKSKDTPNLLSPSSNIRAVTLKLYSRAQSSRVEIRPS